MCRLFAVSAPTPFKVQHAFRALQRLSQEHKDGWGIARFDQEPLIVERSLEPAFESTRFGTLTDQLSATRLLAHIRLASVGSVRPENTHPFHAAGLAFMHNGTVRRFAERRAMILAEIAPALRASIHGETDSEHCFALLRTYLDAGGGERTTQSLSRALARVFLRVAELYDEPGLEPRSAMNFMVSDGHRIIASRRGRTLFHGTFDGALVIASERLWDSDDWKEVPEDTIVAIDGHQFQAFAVSDFA